MEKRLGLTHPAMASFSDSGKRPSMKTAEDLLEQCGGNKLVKKVLIANNGISAVKVCSSFLFLSQRLFFLFFVFVLFCLFVCLLIVFF